MRVLLTGASSFTGYWFANELAKAGHTVVAPLRTARSNYQEGPRADRVSRLSDVADVVDDCPFGSDRFCDVAAKGNFDVLCHHAAQVGDYRSADFDVVAALAANTNRLRSVLNKGQFGALVLTGSVFEQNEGVGDAPLRAFSLYGLSKALTAEIVEHHCRDVGISFHKFVIPNPFGPLEEPRFCAYLTRTWKADGVAMVNTPAYVRDNIHVGLLALAYVRYVGEAASGTARRKLNPSGYIETQGDFAERFAREMRTRLGLACDLNLAQQTDFPDPVMRVNTDSATRYVAGWHEATAWDAVAETFDVPKVR